MRYPKSFDAVSRTTRRVDDLASQLKVAKEDHKQVMESHLLLGRRFQQVNAAKAGAAAMDKYHEDLARAADVSTVPLQLNASSVVYAEAGDEFEEGEYADGQPARIFETEDEDGE